MRLIALVLFAALVIDAQSIAPLGSWTPIDPHTPSCGAAVCVMLKDGRTLKTGRDAAEIYDPAKSAWTPAGSTHEARTGHTATLLQDGRVLIAGGGTRSLEIFDPKANTWTVAAGQLSAARSRHAATLLADGSVLISGGQDGDASLSSTDVFDPVSGNVTSSGFLTVPRAGHTATTLLDGKVLIAGGDGLASAEIYDPELQSFSPAGAMMAARTGHVAILLPDNNQVLLAGGRGAGLASAEIYTPWTGTFQAVAPMAAASADAQIVAGKRGTANVASDGGAEAFHFPTVTAVRGSDGSVKIDGEGWQPEEVVRLSVQGRHESAHAGDKGDFTAQLPLKDPAAVTESTIKAIGNRWQALVAARYASTTTVTSYSCADTYGDVDLAQGTVTGDVRTRIIPTGTVTLKNTATGTSFPAEFPLDSTQEWEVVLGAEVGTNTYAAVYSGDSLYAGSSSNTFTCSGVQKAVLTEENLTSSPNPSVFGQPVQFTDSLIYPSNAGLPPSGQMQFYYGTTVRTPLGNATLQNGTAVLTTTVPLAPGQYQMGTIYAGDLNYSNLQDSFDYFQTVTAASTLANMSVTPNPATYGQQVTVQFNVTPVPPSTLAIPQGNCTLTVDGSAAGCGPLDNTGAGTTVFPSGLPAGTHALAFLYPNNSSFTSSSSTATLVVNKATTTTLVSSSSNPSTAGQSVTLTAGVLSSTQTIPTGTVTFSDGLSTLGAVMLSGSGIAVLPNLMLAAGSHAITATYGGDANFIGSSNSLTQMVNPGRSPCDVNGDGIFTVVDVQGVINEALGAAQAADDVNQDGRVNVIDLQIAINAVRRLGCTL